MNSPPLSQSIPRTGNGIPLTTSVIVATTWTCRLSGTVRFSVHPVAMSVTVKVKQNRPAALPPSWATRSTSTNPGASSS